MKKTILILATAAFAFGMNSCKKSDTTTTTPTVVAPVASYSYSPTTVLAGSSIQFTDNSSNNPTSWAWDFGDGGIPGTAKSVAHTYQTTGTYNVTLSVSNSAGSNSITKQIVVTAPNMALAGTYNVTETDLTNGINNSTYTSVISATNGSTTNINFSKFNNSSNLGLIGSISGNTITLSGSAGGCTITGTGTISGTTITFIYSAYNVNTSITKNYSAVFVKQ